MCSRRNPTTEKPTARQPEPSGLVLVMRNRFSSVYQLEGDSENQAIIGGDGNLGWRVNIQRLQNGRWKADLPYNGQPRFASLGEAETASARLIRRGGHRA